MGCIWFPWVWKSITGGKTGVRKSSRFTITAAGWVSRLTLWTKKGRPGAAESHSLCGGWKVSRVLQLLLAEDRSHAFRLCTQLLLLLPGLSPSTPVPARNSRREPRNPWSALAIGCTEGPQPCARPSGGSLRSLQDSTRGPLGDQNAPPPVPSPGPSSLRGRC